MIKITWEEAYRLYLSHYPVYDRLWSSTLSRITIPVEKAEQYFVWGRNTDSYYIKHKPPKLWFVFY
jgi:hypothetical protein